MTTTTNAPALATAQAAAQAALAVLPSSTPLAAGQPAGELIALDGQAVTARFSGASTGEIVIVVAQDLADALAASPLGELDLAKAIAPAIQAAAETLGPVVVDPGQIAEASVALSSLASKGPAMFVPLTEGNAVRAVIALIASPWPGGDGKPGEPRPYTPPPVSRSAGLDLLHDVEMEVTAELGRTRMSVRELLSLAPGAVVELDRAAGAPTDLLVNGRLIARGEVVVIDENFGIRITEIVSERA
ncbi:MAG: Flagellar motor switch protein fliM [Actinomycetia bacterium]|jgi:flagellar motor switch protein FliN/FliY|nr:Flagellar motor switch protein fliM [Actinomycetes bacterium]